MKKLLSRLTGTDRAAGPVRAVVIDLDNIGLPATGGATRVLNALLEAAGDYQVAIAAGRDISFAAYGDACTELGVQAFEAPAIPDGADLALVASATSLAALGVTEFVVISGDHAFTRIPGTLRVVIPTGRGLSTRLAERAASVQRVPVSRQAPSRSSVSRSRRRRAGALPEAVPSAVVPAATRTRTRTRTRAGQPIAPAAVTASPVAATPARTRRRTRAGVPVAVSA